MTKNMCPICKEKLAPGDRLVLEYQPEFDQWAMRHLKKVGNENLEQHGFPGYEGFCWHSGEYEPAVVVKTKAGKRRIHQNIWDNWNGYIGNRKVASFGLNEMEAVRWLNGKD